MILSELHNLYERLDNDSSGLVPRMGWSNVKVSWELDIDKEGHLLAAIPLTSGLGKTSKDCAMLRVPQHETRTSGVKPFFLCDSCDYLMGLGEGDRVANRHKASIAFHESVLDGVNGVATRALLLFLHKDERGPLDPEAQGLLDGGFAVLRLQGDHCYLQERPEMIEAWERFSQAEDDSLIGQCAVTGEIEHLARLFPLITGIPGAQSSGASLVSFNKPSFESYGAKQTYNASISERAAFESGEALRYLFRDQMHHINMSGTHVVFWADRPSPKEDMLMFRLLGGSLPSEDADTVEAVRSAFIDMRRGRSIDTLNPQTRYFVLGISPNAARLAVRFFFTDTLGTIASNYGQYLRDIALDGQEQYSLGMLLRQTAVLGKPENVPSTLVGPCFSAMLKGSRFPASLIGSLLSRMRADHASNNAWDMGQRASLMKAYLCRKRRYQGSETTREGELTVALNRDNDNIGYLLGRLFAVMERAQSAGIGETNATIRDRYIGAAAATPARVFPQLFHGLQNSLTAARKRNTGLSILLERELDEIVGTKLSGDALLPSTLDIEDQGEFYIGYYQERVDLWKPRKDADGNAADAAIDD